MRSSYISIHIYNTNILIPYILKSNLSTHISLAKTHLFQWIFCRRSHLKCYQIIQLFVARLSLYLSIPLIFLTSRYLLREAWVLSLRSRWFPGWWAYGGDFPEQKYACDRVLNRKESLPCWPFQMTLRSCSYKRSNWNATKVVQRRLTNFINKVLEWFLLIIILSATIRWKKL